MAERLLEILNGNIPTIVGIDHAFSFPLAYVERYQLMHNWDLFLEDFHEHWPTDEDLIYVDFIRYGEYGKGLLRMGDRKWRRLTDIKSGTAKSVFHFDVEGSVAKSSHSGIPWLLHLRRSLGDKIHFWPFDGWVANLDKHTIVEVYPKLWHNCYPRQGRTSDQHDAYSVCRWMMERDTANELILYFSPNLSPEEKTIASIEGWIFGKMD